MSDSSYDQIENLKRGDKKAFSNLYATHYSRIYRFANSYVRDTFVAGNIVQDAFLVVWENRNKLTLNTNILSYLLTIVKNNSLNYLNRLKTQIKAEEKLQSHYIKELELRCSTLDACNPGELYRSDVEKIINDTVNSLPEQCRRAFYFSRYEGLTNKEIAERMNISLKGVEFHISKALRIFKENLKDYITFLILSLLDFFYKNI